MLEFVWVLTPIFNSFTHLCFWCFLRFVIGAYLILEYYLIFEFWCLSACRQAGLVLRFLPARLNDSILEISL